MRLGRWWRAELSPHQPGPPRPRPPGAGRSFSVLFPSFISSFLLSFTHSFTFPFCASQAAATLLCGAFLSPPFILRSPLLLILPSSFPPFSFPPCLPSSLPPFLPSSLPSRSLLPSLPPSCASQAAVTLLAGAFLVAVMSDPMVDAVSPLSYT